MTLWVEKDSDQMRATFVACGLASLLAKLLEDQPQSDVRIQDLGTVFQLEAPATRTEIVSRVHGSGLPQLLPAILKPLTKLEQKQ